MKINIKKLPQSMVEIEGELEAEIFESYYTKALKKIGENLEIDGFRKGKVPENILVSKVPEIKILEEMAEMALGENYGKILDENKIDAISRPEIMITKLARNNPLGFNIKTAILPEVKMADYKEIAKKVLKEIPEEDKNIVVSGDEVEKVILDIRKSRAPRVEVAEGAEAKEGEKELEPVLPELNDEFVKGMGPFENVDDFKKKLKENLILEKTNQSKEKTRIKMIEAIIEKSEMELPEILVKSETDKIIHRMQGDIAQMGLKFEDYLVHLKKTIDEIRADFRKDAEQRSRLSLVLANIAKLENIKPAEEDIEHEVSHILETYKDADPESARMHTENVLTNEKVFQFLEIQQ
ncbi:MAG: trigger factor [Candidatus Nomurabacteria bacterium]|nr:trigger factor [Candidatus Nomurabacteria bacterium]